MTFNVTAVILRQEDWRENDAWVTMYTRERGKIEALAKGLRKIESKLASHLEPFMTAEIFLAQGRHWPIVAGSIVEQARLGLRDDFDRLSLAGAIARLADLMTPLESRDENIYGLLDETLTIVSENDLDQSARESLIHLFAWKIMALSGYRPELKRCLRCRRRVGVENVYCDVRHGGIIHYSCSDKKNVIKLMPISTVALRGLAYMTEAPISHVLRLRGSYKSFAEMNKAVSLFVEERYEQPISFIDV